MSAEALHTKKFLVEVAAPEAIMPLKSFIFVWSKKRVQKFWGGRGGGWVFFI